MKQRRMRAGKVTLLGHVLFLGGALGLWAIAAYWEANLIGMVLSGAALAIGFFVAIIGDRRDYRRSSPEGMLPTASVFISLAGYLFGLALVGIVLIAIDNEWSNTAWVIVEAACLGLSLVLFGIGLAIEKKRRVQ